MYLCSSIINIIVSAIIVVTIIYIMIIIYGRSAPSASGRLVSAGQPSAPAAGCRKQTKGNTSTNKNKNNYDSNTTTTNDNDNTRTLSFQDHTDPPHLHPRNLLSIWPLNRFTQSYAFIKYVVGSKQRDPDPEDNSLIRQETSMYKGFHYTFAALISY